MARDLAERTGASLWLHAVVDDTISSWAGLTPMAAPGRLRADHRVRVSAARELLAERLEGCPGVSADGTVVVGSPTGELVLASEGLDLLVLGSRRWGPVRRLALGSTSERVIRHTAVPGAGPAARRGASEHEVTSMYGPDTSH